MSVFVTSVLVITCQREADADLLAEQWPNLTNWCGFTVIRRNTEKHNQKMLLAFISGGRLNLETVPGWVEEIKVFVNTASFQPVKQRLWPGSHKNGHPSAIDPILLFQRWC